MVSQSKLKCRKCNSTWLNYTHLNVKVTDVKTMHFKLLFCYFWDLTGTDLQVDTNF